jgi:hypothetical protein
MPVAASRCQRSENLDALRSLVFAFGPWRSRRATAAAFSSGPMVPENVRTDWSSARPSSAVVKTKVWGAVFFFSMPVEARGS